MDFPIDLTTGKKRSLIVLKRSFKNYRVARSLLITAFFVGMMFMPPQAVSFQAAEQTKGSANLTTAISQVARQNISAVVHIAVTQRQEVANLPTPFDNETFFRYFFDTPRIRGKFTWGEVKGLGTGMIMDCQGHVLTNNHVVGGATEMQVLLSSGRQYPAQVVGTDPKTDLAVVHISAKEPLLHVTFADSDKVEVGDWVVAIGRPGGLDQTVTQGIISAKHRTGIMDPSTYQDFLQTDAAINPGNSGGPLLNLQGEVIAVNAAIVPQSGDFEGMGFAIPSNMALYIAKALISDGKVERGWLGMSVQDLTAELAKSFGVERTKGALIAGVFRGGPAEKAGMRTGDIVINYRRKVIKDSSILQSEVAISPIGQEVKLTVLRDGKKVELTAKIGRFEDAARMLSGSMKERLGAAIRPATAQEAEKYGFSPKKGVVVVWLDPHGPLGQVGFEVGDMILEINGQPVEDLKAFVDLVNSLGPNQQMTLLALDHRSGRTGYVQLVVQ